MSKTIGITAFYIWFSCAHPALARCTITTPNLNFGNFNPLQLANKDISSIITISCNPGSRIINYTLRLSSGGGAGTGGYNPRQMALGANRLNYNLYTDPARSTIWGDGSGGTFTVSAVNAECVTTPCQQTIYGRLFAPQPTAAVGSYSSTITVTLTY